MTQAVELHVEPTAAQREDARLAAIRALRLLDEPASAAVNDLARLAAEVCGAPTALVNIIDDRWQTSVSCVGGEMDPVARDQTLCSRTIVERRTVVTTDAREDPRFRDSPYVTGERASIRFYVSVPLNTEAGDVVGTLCVYDTEPRVLGPAGARMLTALARQIVVDYELRRAAAESAERARELAAMAERTEAVTRMLRTALEYAPHGTAILGVTGPERGVMIRVNPALTAMLARPDLAGTPLIDIIDAQDADAVRAAFDRIAEGAEDRVELVCRVGAGGGYLFLQVSLALVRDPGGGPAHALLQARDVTRQRTHEEWLTRHATTDPLTGLANRLAMRIRLEAEIDRLRLGSGGLGVLIVDLDRFKTVNDVLGHETVDELLVAVAGALAAAAGPEGLVSRLGGDEFIVLAPGLAGADLPRLVERVKDAVLEAGTEVSDRLGYAITGSVGAVLTRNPATAPEDLIRRADQGRYADKGDRQR